jgi:cell division protein FtsB
LLDGSVRWDRLGRTLLLGVLLLIVYLYIGPARSYFSTRAELGRQRAAVAQLAAENKRLKERRSALTRPKTLEAEARRLGMVRPGERAYAIEGSRSDR